MKSMKTSRLIPAALAVGILGAATSHAYVDIELDGNHHVIGETYSAAGDKVIVYRPSGAIELDRAAVRSIQERSGEMPAGVQSVSSGAATSARGASSSGGASFDAASADTGATTQRSVKDPKAHDEQLGHELVQMRLNRLAAKQRGDDETIKQLDKEIKARQAERETNWKKLEATSGYGGSAD
jgi:hypothetical protein